MPVFTYEALPVGGGEVLIRGKIDATDVSEARAMLRQQGRILSKITPATKNAWLAKAGSISLNPNHISAKDMAWMAHKLAGSAATGLSLPRAMEVIAKQKPKSQLAPIMTDIATKINQGIPLSAAFDQHVKALGPTTVALIKAGESSGTLAQALERLAEMMDDRRELQQTLRSAMVYPALSMVFTLGIAAFLLLVIVPKFQGFFAILHGKLPALTQYIVDVSNFLRANWWFIPLMIAAVVFVWWYAKTNPDARRVRDRIMLKIPVLGPVFNGAALARIASTMSTLLGAGLGIQDTLSMAGEVAANEVHKEALLRARELMLREGLPLSRSLTQASNLHGELALAAATGEENGQLVATLGRHGAEQSSYVRSMTKALSSTMEPILIMVLGVVVGTIVVAFYLPEFAMIKDIHS